MIRHSLDDTIAAISTPLGQGGIGIVRMSGKDGIAILSQLFLPARKEMVSPPPSRRMILGHVIDPRDGRAVDEVLACYMPMPGTYTREDIVEIHCHGGIMAARAILELCLAQGARHAGRGEFTLRAFLNGRIDLAQAEAVQGLVNAQTQAGLHMSVGQLSGSLSNRVRRIRQELLKAQAHLVAQIDFPEDEIPPFEVQPTLGKAEDALLQLLRDADKGIILRSGIRTAIIGRPNVGKSSLLNALLRTERAIVTPIPGTTRDTVEETLNLHGIPLVLIDTAGLDESPRDYIEQLGIERSRGALERADLILTVLDGSMQLQEEDLAILKMVEGRTAILVINKADLQRKLDSGQLPSQHGIISLSALTGQGLEQLEDAISSLILGGQADSASDPLVSNARHKAALSKALEHVRAARQALHAGMADDFISIDLEGALFELGSITGETADEELLDRIFADFCIGK